MTRYGLLAGGFVCTLALALGAFSFYPSGVTGESDVKGHEESTGGAAPCGPDDRWARSVDPQDGVENARSPEDAVAQFSDKELTVVEVELANGTALVDVVDSDERSGSLDLVEGKSGWSVTGGRGCTVPSEMRIAPQDCAEPSPPPSPLADGYDRYAYICPQGAIR